MVRSYGAVRAAASVIAQAADATIDAYRESRIVDEPHITDRLMGSIETAINGLATSAVVLPFGGGVRTPLRWQAMTLRAGSRSAAHEKRFGADILGVLTVSIRDYKIAKGFLAQAKRAEPRHPFTSAEWGRFQGQCKKMLDITPDAFAIIYSRSNGVRFFAASAVASYSERDIFDLYNLGARSFFEKHFQSFIGDPRLDKPTVQTLENLHLGEPDDVRPSAHVLHLTASEAE